MRLGDRPIAALIRLDHGSISIPWKVAFDEEFAAFSPGKQLMCDETRRWLSDPTIRRVDPVCEEDNPMMSLLWPKREPYGTLILSSSSWGISARMRARLSDLKSETKAQVKRLLHGSRRRTKSRPKSGRRPAPSHGSQPRPA